MESEKVWYEMKAEHIAMEMTLNELTRHHLPIPTDPSEIAASDRYHDNLQKARGIQFGDVSYAEMYMKERELILSKWETFFRNLCQQQGINVTGKIFVAGINDGQEVGCFPRASICGVDISSEAVNRGKVRYPHMQFIQADLTTFTVKQAAFDTVFSLRTVDLFPPSERKQILQNAFRALKRGGKMVVSIPGGYLKKGGKMILEPEEAVETTALIASEVSGAGFMDVHIVNHIIELFVISSKV